MFSHFQNVLCMLKIIMILLKKKVMSLLYCCFFLKQSPLFESSLQQGAFSC